MDDCVDSAELRGNREFRPDLVHERCLVLIIHLKNASKIRKKHSLNKLEMKAKHHKRSTHLGRHQVYVQINFRVNGGEVGLHKVRSERTTLTFE